MVSKDTSLDELNVLCNQELLQYMAQRTKDSPACYELFRRALEESDHEAFRLVYQIYQHLVEKWIVQHSSYVFTQQPVQHFVSVTYTNFFFSLRGKPISNFPDVSRIMAYLKTCVHTAIVQHIRLEKKHQYNQSLSETAPAKVHPETQEFDELWSHMCRLVETPQDQMLMRAAFIEDYKPAEIAENHPDEWDSPRAVTVALYRIRRILRRDPIIREMAGIQPAEEDV